jgi:general secretion pathway protein G
MRIRSKLEGFTIIELMFVVMIIGIIAAITVPNYIKFAKRAKEIVVTENMHTFQLAVETFAVEQPGRYPQAADEAAFKTLMPLGRYPNNPFTQAETVVVWQADPINPGEIAIFNLAAGGYRIRGRGVNGFLDDVVSGN